MAIVSYKVHGEKNQGNLEGESVVVSILLSCTEVSYCASVFVVVGFFSFFFFFVAKPAKPAKQFPFVLPFLMVSFRQNTPSNFVLCYPFSWLALGKTRGNHSVRRLRRMIALILNEQ